MFIDKSGAGDLRIFRLGVAFAETALRWLFARFRRDRDQPGSKVWLCGSKGQWAIKPIWDDGRAFS